MQVNPFEPEIDWFTRDKEISSLSAAPEPTRRFLPSKWEEKKCAPRPPPSTARLAEYLLPMLRIQPANIVAQLYIRRTRVDECIGNVCTSPKDSSLLSCCFWTADSVV